MAHIFGDMSAFLCQNQKICQYLRMCAHFLHIFRFSIFVTLQRSNIFLKTTFVALQTPVLFSKCTFVALQKHISDSIYTFVPLQKHNIFLKHTFVDLQNAVFIFDCYRCRATTIGFSGGFNRKPVVMIGI